MSTEDRRAELLAKKVEREKQREAEAEAHKLLLLELEDRFEEEVGVRGRDYEIVDLGKWGEGAIVVALPKSVHIRAFRNSKMNEPQKWDLVKACLLYPEVDKLKEVAARRDFVISHCANAACELHALDMREREGK